MGGANLDLPPFAPPICRCTPYTWLRPETGGASQATSTNLPATIEPDRATTPLDATLAGLAECGDALVAGWAMGLVCGGRAAAAPGADGDGQGATANQTAMGDVGDGEGTQAG